MASYQAFQEVAALAVARDAEEEADQGGADALRWEMEAVEARLKAAAAKRKREFKWRAALK